MLHTSRIEKKKGGWSDKIDPEDVQTGKSYRLLHFVSTYFCVRTCPTLTDEWSSAKKELRLIQYCFIGMEKLIGFQDWLELLP